MTNGIASPIPLLFSAVLTLTSGCHDKTGGSGDSNSDTQDSGLGADLDGDGWTAAQGDCDDTQAAVSPGGTEVMGDGIDQNCDASDAAPVADLSDAEGVWYGVSRSGLAGWATTIVNDVDSDGLDDILVGAPAGRQDWAEEGRAYLLYGPATVVGELIEADIQLHAESGFDTYGSALASVGDGNGDGWGDVVIGAPANPEGGIQAGAVYLGLGPDLESQILLLGSDGRATATALAAHFDLDGDGIQDVHVGSPSVGNSSPGRTDVILGPFSTEMLTLDDTDVSLTGESVLDYAGQSVAAGDMNGDGYGDLAVGAPISDMDGDMAGRAYVIFGPRFGSLSLADADAILSGETVGAEAGVAMACAADLDGDEADDLMIGAHLDEDAGDRAGKVYLLYALSTGSRALADSDAIFVGETTHEMVGLRLAATTMADGAGALLVSAPRDLYATGGYPGKVYLFDGLLAGDLSIADVSLVYAGTSPNEAAGVGVGSGGDVNGDGSEDIVVGAPYNGVGAEEGGAVYISLGGG